MSQPTVIEKVLYTANATATGGRDGVAKSDDGKLEVTLNPPPALGGTGAGTNPEQLFAAGYAACFASAVGVVARAQSIAVGAFTISADVTIGKDESGFGIAAKLIGSFPELSKEQAQKVMEAAHQVCPYSKATRGNINVELTVA